MPSRDAHHALVIGGTGMLAGVTLALAASWRISAVARRPARLAVPQTLATHPITPLALDYTDSAALQHALRAATAQNGPIGLVVAWIHTTAPDAPFQIADFIEAEAGARPDAAPLCRFVHVLGSATADPSKPDRTREQRFAAYRRIAYQPVILGFVAENTGSRWLTDDEISRGVLDAIAGDPDPVIVGTVSPWSNRP